MDMKCAACRNVLERARRGDVQFWRCGCGAHLIAISSVRRMLPEGMWKDIWPTLRAAATPGSRSCPGCQNRMDVSTTVEHFGGQSIDVCDRCQMLWLDPQELETMPKRDVPPELPLEVRQAIGRAMAKAIGMEYDAREATIGAPFDLLAQMANAADNGGLEGISFDDID